ncbi:MAG TPA: Uma2 family endonuclease [Pirellulales bacterium]|nr:Uma2 family endonuclease [Pirellulales bacterium]
MPVSTRPLPGTTIDPLYPETDGEPMGEGAFHLAAILHLYDALSRLFELREDVYVAADMFVYYEQGNPSAKRAPDVMVAKGVMGNHPRQSFRTWEEGVVPAVVFEVTSKKTRDEDEKVKKIEYAMMGVAEYFLFDPEGLGMESPLRGFRLRDGQYAPLPDDTAGRMASRELGLTLEVEGPLLRLIDPRTGRRLMTYSELADVAEEAEEAKRRAAELEAELARLRAAQDT